MTSARPGRRDRPTVDGRIVRQHSAGGLVVRGDRILLISTRDGERWQLPKGRVEPGETSERAAVREIYEETGVRGRTHSFLGSVTLRYVEGGRRVRKQVDYYVMEYWEGSVEDFDANEVSKAVWFSWRDGLNRLTFDNERELVLVAAGRLAPEAVAAASS